MSLDQKIFFPNQYIQAEGLLDRLPEMMSKYGEHCMALVAPEFSDRTKVIMQDNKNAVIEVFRGEVTHAEINRVYEIARNANVTVLAGIGGGKALDVAKVAADKLGIPVIIVPTIASTDAPCTGNAVIYNEDGVVVDFLKQKERPKIVMVDTEIIAKAPVRFLVSGMGDALATGYEANSLAKSGAKTYYGGRLTETGLALARLASDTVLKYGRQAKEDCVKGTVTPALEKIIEANILLSGIGFESTNIATAHTIHNALTRLPQTKPYQHGEKVAFGILVGLHLNNVSKEELDELYNFSNDVGLPITFAELGLQDITAEELQMVAEDACGEHSFIFNEPVEITVDKVRAALYAADEYGKKIQAGA